MARPRKGFCPARSTGPHGLGAADISGASACGNCQGAWRWEVSGKYVRSRTAQGDEGNNAKWLRPSIGKPVMGHANKERVLLFGTDQRITSGPAAERPHSKAGYMTAPKRFADSPIPLAPRAPSIHDPSATSSVQRSVADSDRYLGNSDGATAARYGTRAVSGFPFSNILNVTVLAGAEFSETFACIGCSRSTSPL